MEKRRVLVKNHEGETGSEDSNIFVRQLLAHLQVKGIKTPKGKVIFSSEPAGPGSSYALEAHVHPHNYGHNLGATIEFRIPGKRTYIAELKVVKHMKPGAHALEERDYKSHITTIEKGVLEGLELLDSWQEKAPYQPEQRIPVPAVG